MEIVLCERPFEYVLDYVKKEYPYCDCGVVGDVFGLSRSLNKIGIRTYELEKEHPESIRFIIALGGDEEIDFAKSFNLPYLVISSGVPLSVFHNFGIYNFQKIEYGYPKLVILDSSKDEYLFQAEVRILLLSLYVECVSLCGSGLKGEREKKAREIIKSVRGALGKFTTTGELLTLLPTWISQVGGLEQTAFINLCLGLYHPESTLQARFYALFSLLYLLRRFTNIDFWVILPYMDEVRVRTLAETSGIKIPPLTKRRVDLAYQLGLVKELLPTESELGEMLGAFRLEGGEEGVDLDAILSAITLGATLCQRKDIVRDIVECGYVDALLS